MLLLEFEDTLVGRSGEVVRGAPETFSTLQKFVLDDGESLPLCLLSWSGARWKAQGKSASEALASQLAELELRTFFEPFEKRVTIGFVPNAQGIDRALLAESLARSGAGAQAEDSVVVCGAEADARVAEEVGMHTFRYSIESGSGVRFADWAELPLLVATLFRAAREKNRAAALHFYLSERKGLDTTSLQPSGDGGIWEGTANAWQPISTGRFVAFDGVHVKLPVRITLRLDSLGRIERLEQTEPPSEDRDEARNFVESLAQHGQIATESGAGSKNATHAVRVDDEGKRYLVRRGFSAV